jgi:uncharacterized protein YndB with AHSA1/START domain
VKTRILAERVLDAPADVVYRCLADYEHHHRPEGFLPPSFFDFRVERGGYGAGTVISYKTSFGGRVRPMTAEVSEPQPGRVLVESGPGATTVFSVEPVGNDKARVRFDTTLEDRGLQGLLMRVVAPRLVVPLYFDELRRLEQHAQRVRAAEA